MKFSMETMWPELSALNLEEEIPELRVPAFFFLGRHDHVIPPEASLPFIEKLSAPIKKVLWFEDSGHLLSIEEPAKFNRAMMEWVRPVIVREERKAA
ncbi:MAG: hypothetical protein ACXWPM_03970 [Bdellovibrionota bacterium]